MENASHQEYIIDKDFVFGDIISHPPEESQTDFQIYPILEVLAEFDEKEKRKVMTLFFLPRQCAV